MMKHILKRAVFLLFALLVTVFLSFRITDINATFPNMCAKTVPLHDTGDFYGCSLTVDGFSSESIETFFSKHPDTGLNEKDYSFQSLDGSSSVTTLFLVEVTVTNPSSAGSAPIRLPLYELALSDGVWNNEMPDELVAVLNPKASVSMELEAGQSRSLILPYLRTAQEKATMNTQYVLEQVHYPDWVQYQVSI